MIILKVILLPVAGTGLVADGKHPVIKNPVNLNTKDRNIKTWKN
jgi:hypothetical protein